MPTPFPARYCYIPPPRPNVVVRSRLFERLNAGLYRQLPLISAPAGFGKTTLLSAWLAGRKRPAAWLSLDAGEHDPARFLTSLIAALQTIVPHVGERVVGVLQSPQPPPTEALLTVLLNDLTDLTDLTDLKTTTTSADPFILVLDDYHLIDAQPVDQALTYLVEHLPPHLHLVIATREDPHLPLARLRAGNHVTELRAADLRFTQDEAAAFLTQVMGLTLSTEDIAALETRTEGWIAGLQLAAISLQGRQDASSFIQSFTGSHHFVMDYLVEEVLQRQPASVQTFLLRTSILERLCGPLCDAVLLDPAAAAAPGQATLEYLEHANLFIVPLDNERLWDRYHHLFADLLRQRLHQSFPSSPTYAPSQAKRCHLRSSRWYEDHGLEIEAFHHAAAANDIERAERLMEGKGIPLHFRGAVTALLDWLASLPASVLNARPSLWRKDGSIFLGDGQKAGGEEKLQAAGARLQGAEGGDKTPKLVRAICGGRGTFALTRYQIDAMITQSRRALEYLYPDNLSLRANANWTLGFAYFLQGDRAAAR